MLSLRRIAAGSAVLAALWGAGLATTPAGVAKPAAKTAKKPAKKPAKTTRRKLPGGLIIEDLKVGTGAVAKLGQHVTVNYRGMLTNGTIFDESYKRGAPFDFNLGAGQVIKGWDQGVAGMKVGGKRKLTIPSTLGYGA